MRLKAGEKVRQTVPAVVFGNSSKRLEIRSGQLAGPAGQLVDAVPMQFLPVAADRGAVTAGPGSWR